MYSFRVLNIGIVLSSLGVFSLIAARPAAAQNFGGRYVYQAVDDPLAVGGTLVQGLNNQGQAVGFYRGADGANHGFIDTRGNFTELNVPGASGTLAAGINGLGQVVGIYTDTNGANVYSFVETNGVYTTLSAAGLGAGTTALGINDAGTIVGSTSGQAFSEAGGVVTLLSDPNTTEGTPNANGINNFGQIVGDDNGLDGYSHGFLDTNGVFTSVGPPSGAMSAAYGVSDSGEVVGTYSSGFNNVGYAVVNGTFESFSEPGAIGTQFRGVNDAGQIAGFYEVYAGGPSQSFILTPVPEASTTVSFGLLLALGLGSAAFARKKRSAA